MYISLVVVFITFLLLSTLFQKKEKTIIKELKKSLFYAEGFEWLVAFSARETNLKKAASIYLTKTALDLSLQNATLSTDESHKYQEIDLHNYLTLLNLFPNISGVFIFYVKDKKLTNIYFPCDKFFELAND